MSKKPTILPSRRSRVILTLLGASFVIPLAILLPLLALNVRLGQGYFAYRYSPVRDWRIPRTLPLLLIGAVGCAAVYLLSQSKRVQRALGIALFALSLIGFSAWNWWAPPEPVNQQMFNMTSFSSDGAFAVEARKISSVTQYLQDFPQRLQTSVEEMGGTRVLSNPPLTTVLAYSVMHGADAEIGWLERLLVRAQGIEPQDAPMIADALRVSIALSILWMLSGVAAYALGRVFLSPAGSAVFAIIVVFNPCTVHFAPGKDPAQLLTINLMLWAWFAGWKRRSMTLSAIAGAVLIVGATAGLVHIWVAAIALIATLWETFSQRDSLRHLLTRSVIPASLGSAIVCAIVYLLIGWNIPRTLLAVSARWGEIQRTFEMNRTTWFIIGLPIFLLFLSPGVWTLLGLSIRRRRMNFGTRLAFCTVAVMLFIYVAMGVTYELPRLWIAFLPTLVLGLAIDRPLFRGRGEHPRVAQALALIVAFQILFTAFHWTLFDAREAEFRLMSRRYYN
jgi:hypothetical protein